MTAYEEPKDVELAQDWGTPWTRYPTSEEDDKAIGVFLSAFYFGEG